MRAGGLVERLALALARNLIAGAVQAEDGVFGRGLGPGAESDLDAIRGQSRDNAAPSLRPALHAFFREDDGGAAAQARPREGQGLVALREGQQDAPGQPGVFITHDQARQAGTGGLGGGGRKALAVLQRLQFFGLGFEFQQTGQVLEIVSDVCGLIHEKKGKKRERRNE